MEQPEQIQSLRRLLDEAQADYAILEHSRELRSPEDGVDAGLGDLPDMAPTFILKTGHGWLAAVIGGDRRLSYKKIKKVLRLRDVSLASPELTRELTGAQVGTISPINPGMQTLVDIRLLDRPEVFGGCGVPLYTLKITPADLVRITVAKVFDFTEDKAPE
jgi:prolyl-tRNA editing enzyme YbaK/EbsC (Cys-tRNA(Pro) deacylase)